MQVIRSAAVWEAFTTTYWTEPVPSVDFETDMVVAILYGTQSACLNDLNVLSSLDETDDAVELHLEPLPDVPPACDAPMYLSRVLRVTRRAKPVCFVGHIPPDWAVPQTQCETN